MVFLQTGAPVALRHHFGLWALVPVALGLLRAVSFSSVLVFGALWLMLLLPPVTRAFSQAVAATPSLLFLFFSVFPSMFPPLLIHSAIYSSLLASLGGLRLGIRLNGDWTQVTRRGVADEGVRTDSFQGVWVALLRARSGVRP